MTMLVQANLFCRNRCHNCGSDAGDVAVSVSDGRERDHREDGTNALLTKDELDKARAPGGKHSLIQSRASTSSPRGNAVADKRPWRNGRNFDTAWDVVGSEATNRDQWRRDGSKEQEQKRRERVRRKVEEGEKVSPGERGEMRGKEDGGRGRRRNKGPCVTCMYNGQVKCWVRIKIMISDRVRIWMRIRLDLATSRDSLHLAAWLNTDINLTLTQNLPLH